MFEIPKDNLATRIRLSTYSVLSRAARQVAGIEQNQLVVCGFPRSGTSLLYNMLSSTLPGYRFEPFEQYFIYRLHRLGNYATKAPMDVLHLPQIDELNRNKKNLAILILVRDIRDVLTSRHPFIPGQYFIGYDHSWWPQDKAFKTWSYDAPGILDIHNAIEAIRDRPDVMVIHYEDLAARPDQAQQALASRFGFVFTDKFSRFDQTPEKHAYRYEGKYAPVDRKLVREQERATGDRIGRWRLKADDRQRVISQFQTATELFDVLETFGYETSREWFDDLIRSQQPKSFD